MWAKKMLPRASAVAVMLSMQGGASGFRQFPTNWTNNSTTTRIDSDNFGYSGPLPTEIGLLTALTFLDLQDNWFTGPIPTELGLATRLKEAMTVYNNELSGTVPTQLGRLTEMVTVFSVGQNLQVTGTIPTQLGNLVNMKSGLWLNQNSQSGAIPTQLGRLGQMTASFALKKNRLTVIPTQLGELSKMAERFYLHENSLSDSTIPTQLGKLSQLNSYFGLKSCKVTSTIPTQLGKLSLLISGLYLNDNKITKAMPTQLGKLSQLKRRFELGTNLLTKSIPTQFGKLTQLVGLVHLESNALDGTIPTQFGNLVQMSSDFKLFSNLLTGTIPTQFGKFSMMASVFWLDANSLSKTIPTQLGLLGQMSSSFGLSSNKLSKSIPTQFGNLSQMKNVFWLHKNKLSKAIPTHLGNLVQMTSGFDLSANHLGHAIPTQLGRLSQVTAGFYLNNNNFCSKIPTEVALLKGNIDDCSIEHGNSRLGTDCDAKECGFLGLGCKLTTLVPSLISCLVVLVVGSLIAGDRHLRYRRLYRLVLRRALRKPLACAVMRGNSKKLEQLIDQGDDVNLQVEAETEEFAQRVCQKWQLHIGRTRRNVSTDGVGLPTRSVAIDINDNPLWSSEASDFPNETKADAEGATVPSLDVNDAAASKTKSGLTTSGADDEVHRLENKQQSTSQSPTPTSGLSDYAKAQEDAAEALEPELGSGSGSESGSVKLLETTTPIYLAVEFAAWSILGQLLAAGANPLIDTENKDGNTPLHAAFLPPHHDAVKKQDDCNREYGVQALLKFKCDPNTRNKKRDTPLHLASKVAEASTIKILLDAHANPRAQNQDGSTALHLAVQADVVQALLNGHGDPYGIKDNEGKSVSLIAFVS
mmetsp:Transcript_11519/g.30989  ORF Transcript_11519/g.30989 Transcript_11519/m.30989 type:complete len:867 (-) Transcript_11519:163-2763(-)